VTLEIGEQAKIDYKLTEDPFDEWHLDRDDRLFNAIAKATIKHFSPAGPFWKAVEDIKKETKNGPK
jgi:hypothetical protein